MCIRSLIYQLFTSFWICVWKKLKMVDAHVANRCHCLSIIGWYTYRHTFSQSLSSFCLLLNRWFYYKNKKIHKITHIYTVHDTSGVRARGCVGFNIKFSNLPLALWSAVLPLVLPLDIFAVVQPIIYWKHNILAFISVLFFFSVSSEWLYLSKYVFSEVILQLTQFSADIALCDTHIFGWCAPYYHQNVLCAHTK